RLRTQVLEAYRAHLDGLDPPKSDLGSCILEGAPGPGERSAIPAEVLAAYEYYYRTMNDRDLGAVRVYQVPVRGAVAYAVRVTTDGDSGWLEVYDRHGRLLGAARTYLEIAAWGDRQAIRKQVDDFGELPPSLRDAPRQTLWGKPPED